MYGLFWVFSAGPFHCHAATMSMMSVTEIPVMKRGIWCEWKFTDFLWLNDHP